jgi:hypothetical protein
MCYMEAIWYTVQPRKYDTRFYNTLDITTHFCETKIFGSNLPLLYDYQHSIIRYLESPFYHIKEVVNAKTPFIYAMYI